MLLDLRNLDVCFRRDGRELHAVRDLNLQIAAGEVLGVVGESGAGKSQAFLAITRLGAEKARIGGEAWFDGCDLLALREDELQAVRGARIAYAFQDAMTALNPYLTIGAQLEEVLMRHRGMNRAAARDASADMLNRTRIDKPLARLVQYPHQLSGGQRQRVMLAMALLAKPRLLIADEPTTALDVTVQRQVLDMLSDLQQELGFALVLITHDLGVIARVAGRVAVMYAGRIVESGTRSEIFHDARHPYTRGLLAAAPRLHGGAPQPIKGAPPTLDRLPAGCAFAPRCNDVGNDCQRAPREHAISPTHRVLCHRLPA